jgi:DNA-binding GntR family transcriptional regulator
LIKYENLTDLSYINLKKKIISSELTPGERIIEEKIGEQLGVSRTTVKSAIRMLVNDGLLDEVPRQGIYVRKYTVEELIEIYDARASLERLAAARAALILEPQDIKELVDLFNGIEINDDTENLEYMNADMSFHTMIVNKSGCRVISSILSNMHLTISCFAQRIIRPSSLTYQEHMEIVEALAKRDPEKSSQLIEEHIMKTRRVLAESAAEILR